MDIGGRSLPPYFSLTVHPTATAPQGGAAHDSQTIPECPPPPPPPPPRDIILLIQLYKENQVMPMDH